jgi:hypothetical protein
MTGAIHLNDVCDCDWDEELHPEVGYISSLVFHKPTYLVDVCGVGLGKWAEIMVGLSSRLRIFLISRGAEAPLRCSDGNCHRIV